MPIPHLHKPFFFQTARRYTILLMALFAVRIVLAATMPQVSELAEKDYFPIVSQDGQCASIYISEEDSPVVGICARMFASDIERVTGHTTTVAAIQTIRQLPKRPAIVAGTIGHSAIIDGLIKKHHIDVSTIENKWESYMLLTLHTQSRLPLLLIIGSDRRGTAFGLTSLSRAIGVSPWYWWADVAPATKEALYVQDGSFVQDSPSVQYRGIFINDERFGGWARWAEQHFEQETGKVGPKTYQRVFELLLRLRANYLWPAMHPGTQAFNADPENARLADQYAIVMGTSHCEQMLRNNEGEWKAVDEQARREGRVPPMGDFNYITNRETMQRYWEERVQTNGQYENTYTLGLRGIHDYPMEGANTTAERVRMMQQAINDQRDMLRRHIDKPIEEIPQVLCTYEEVLDAYHNGLQVPEDVIMLWSDDKHGYCRNLCNPEEMKRKGGAGIYYHLSYHGDPASWIWLSPLSPAFISTELTKAYEYGARKIWVFNVGDIKPAEKEISFVMNLAWDMEQRDPLEEGYTYIYNWAEETFGPELAGAIGDMQMEYYRLQAAGKDSHVWFIEYSEEQIAKRLADWRKIAERAKELEMLVPERLRDAYFELISYPICGAAMLNEYQLLARRSMVRATAGDYAGAAADAAIVEKRFDDLNQWTNHYNNEIQGGKWQDFFNWQPYHWFRSEKIEQPYATPAVIEEAKRSSSPKFLSVEEALSDKGLVFESDRDGEMPLWIKALSPIRNFSKAAADNIFCHVTTESDSFDASATPINNVWHAPYVGPMWSRVGTLHVQEGRNTLRITDLKSDARIDQIYIGLYPPFAKEPRLRHPADWFDDMRGNLRLCGAGYTGGVLARSFLSPSYEPQDAPYVEYELELLPTDSIIEVRTLPTLHVYEGRDARYAVQIDDREPEIFSIHEGDFTAAWRLNVLRGYASRSIAIPTGCQGKQKIRIYLLDPGIVLQEICVY